MPIRFENLQKKIPLPLNFLRQSIKKIIRYEKLKGANLSFVFVSRAFIKKINIQYLNHHYATDVLTFDMCETKKSRSIKGEVIICPAVALQNSKVYKTSLAGELILYMIHGLLHLLGYDDRSREQKKKMRQKEEALLKRLDFTVHGI